MQVFIVIITETNQFLNIKEISKKQCPPGRRSSPDILLLPPADEQIWSPGYHKINCQLVVKFQSHVS